MTTLIFLLIVLQSVVDVSSSSMFSTTQTRCVHSQWLALAQLRALNRHSPAPPPDFCDQTLGQVKVMEWNMEEDCSSWDGVVCDPAGYVIRLDLNFSMLSGPIFPIFNLQHLQSLNLACNHFNWTSFPMGFEKLRNLTHLDLSRTCFSGQIPVGISMLTRLVSLHLSMISDDGMEQTFVFPEHHRPRLEKPNLESFFMNLNSLKEVYLDGVDLSAQPSNWSQALSSALPHLEVLSLSYCQLNGPIHHSFANLTSIISLDISQNRITGSLPPFHSTSVPNLSYLDMSSNLLTGEIHSSVFTLPSLAVLRLNDNKFSGELEEFSNTSSSVLQVLCLNGNELSGVVPKSIFELPNLIYLSLASNNFSVKIEMLRNLKNVEVLDLSSNSLTVENDDTSYNLPQLHDLILSNCNLSDFPIFLRQVQLLYLNLSDNHIWGYVPSWLVNNTQEVLDLSGNPIDFLEPSTQGNSSFITLDTLVMRSCNISKLPSFLKSLDALMFLDLSNNKIKGEIPGWIWRNQLRVLSIFHNLLSGFDEFPSNVSSNVLALYLYGNHIKGSLPSGICNMSSLEFLDASHNNLSGFIPECLVKLQTLSALNLQGNRYHQMPSNFTLATNLGTLNINGNHLKGKLPRSLANCKMLEILDLGNNMIYDTFPFWLENLPSLKVLVLRNNMFYGQVEIPGAKFVLPSLRIIDLSSNNFTGKLSRDFLQSLSAMVMDGGNKSSPNIIGQYNEYYHDSVTIMNKGYDMVLVKILTIFVSLDLSNNKFYGNVPEEIGELKSLVVLNLSRNAFDGKIPTSLGELSQLESLDFSQNKFSGMIPPQLTRLTFLEVLNLSYNQLAGRIPLGNQFNTFTNSSYIGNAGLCGLPLSRKCSEDYEPAAPSESLESEAMFDWRFVVAGCGFGLVVGLTIGFAFLAEVIIKWLVN